MRYRRVYGYPWRWAIVAELAWRLEHAPALARLPGPYCWRKAAERRGYAAANGGRRP